MIFNKSLFRMSIGQSIWKTETSLSLIRRCLTQFKYSHECNSLYYTLKGVVTLLGGRKEPSDKDLMIDIVFL